MTYLTAAVPLSETRTQRLRVGSGMAAAALAVLLTACGGGGGGDSGGASTPAPVSNTPAGAVTGTAPTLASTTGAPALTGDIATDGFNWFNFRRAQAGLPALARNSLIDLAALNHSRYQQVNGVISHDEVAGNPGFTGTNVLNRLTAAGYQFNRSASLAYGEVIAGGSGLNGFGLAENLITGIYHRFAVFEPVFKEAGAGNAVAPNGYAYLTSDLTANNGFGPGLGRGRVVVYPFASQTGVSTWFPSNEEVPDPVPNQDVVGYPISVHADITAKLVVNSFTVRPRGGSDLAVRLLTAATDTDTPTSAAAIIPLAVLAAGTVYDVTFTGTADGTTASRSWSFTTQ